ncbi:MAG: zinc ribbon domain-containing protein [Candidatus Thorarchaeota archaeon]
MKTIIIYEEKLHISSQKAFELTMQWLIGQYKTKIKIATPHTLIEAKQGTMITHTGHDPNWKKRIRINFYEMEGNHTLIRVEAIPLARTVFRVEKLKQSWYNGLFSHLFSLLNTIGQSSKLVKTLDDEVIKGFKITYCSYCGKRIEETTKICPNCGSEI